MMSGVMPVPSMERPFGDREPQPVLVKERQNRLYGAFAIRGRADDCPRARILQRARENLRGTRAVLIDENGDRIFACTERRTIDLLIAVAVDDGDNHTRRHNLLGDGDAARDESAGVLA